MCYMDHRVFLPMSHPWRANKKYFNGPKELRHTLHVLMNILEILKDFKNDLGKINKNKRDGPWKKISIFFQLPYWAQNTLRHNFDVMHIEKNV